MRFDSNTICVVTGGLGFIGSHFIDLVLNLGWKVINIDKINYASLDIDFGGHGNYYHIKEDISEIKDLPFCDLIVNFAAESHVDNSISASDIFIKSNILGVYNLLEILKKKKIKNEQNSWSYKLPLFVQISTDEVFGDILEGGFDEDSRFKPSNPYSASKAAAENLLTAWGRTYGIPYLITRTTNNYGPRQHPEKLVPMAISKCLNGEKIIVHGNGMYVRNWIHVLDNAEAILEVVQKGTLGEAYHIASDEEYSVVQICTMILEYFGKKFDGTTVNSSLDRSGADIRYALNTQKIKSLGWKQKRDFQCEIKHIIDYYKSRNR